MPKTTFSNENKVQTDNKFPKFKLEHGERALIIAIEPEPEVEYRHTLKAPEIGPDGKVLKEITTTSTGKEYEKVSTEFIGQHLCFGNFDVLESKGIDPENCPTCAASQENNGIDPPQKHYAMHILRYALQPNSWQVREPFAVTCEAWVFGAEKFNQLVDLSNDWDDLRKHDIKLGPCTNGMYQKFDINVIQKSEWLDPEKPERKKLAAEVYSLNKTDNLSALIARKIDKSSALEDIARVQERYNDAYNLNNAPKKTEKAVEMDKDIASLLGDDEPKKESANVPDPFASEAPSDAEKPATKKTRAKKADPEPEAEVNNDASLSFEDLMSNL